LLVTVPIILDQAVGHCSGDFGSGCWLLFPLFWIRLLMNVPMILDQAVTYCSHFWISLLVTVPITLDQAVGYSQQPDTKSPERYPSDSPKINETVINSLIQNNGNSN
jgi:hypothetical protein